MAAAALSCALATLGYENLYDLDDIANGGAEHADFWLQAVQRKLAGNDGFGKPEADALLDGYDASSHDLNPSVQPGVELTWIQGVRNVPAAAFAADLIRCYPSSKVILPTRDVDSWHVYASPSHTSIHSVDP